MADDPDETAGATGEVAAGPPVLPGAEEPPAGEVTNESLAAASAGGAAVTETETVDAAIRSQAAAIVVELAAAGTDREAAGLAREVAAVGAPAPHQQSLSYLDVWERKRRRWRLRFGLGLVVLGLGLFVLQFFGISWLGLLFVTPGICLLTVCIAWRPFYPLMVTGAVLTGAGAGMIIDKAFGVSVSLGLAGLGAGFIGAYAAQRLRRRPAHWWPLLPGVLFVALGLFIGNPYRWTILTRGWPLLIVVAGAAVLGGVLLRGRRPRSSTPRSVDYPLR